jgi:hypothetical protein
MAIGTTIAYLSPDLASVFSECYERAGVSAKTIGNDHTESAFRSIALMLNSEWLNLGIRTYQFVLQTLTVVVGVPQYILPAGLMTLSDAVLRRDSRDTPINPMSRQEYLEVPDKTQQGRPDRYLVDKQYNQVQLTVWRTPENSTDQILYWAMMNTALPGDSDLSLQLQTRPEMQEALHAGLAAKLAMKFNPGRYEVLQTYYRGADPNPRNVGGVLALALDGNRDWGDVRFTMSRPRRGRW